MTELGDVPPFPPRRGPLRAPRRARMQGAWLVAALIPVAVIASFVLAGQAGGARPGLSAALTLALALAGAALILRGLGGPLYPHTRLGLCNAVTLLRAAGLAVLAGLVVAPAGAGWGIAALAALVLVLDVVDGWLARRTGLSSEFGARFDVETDVLFAIVAATLAWQADKVGGWFLMLGALRPAFLLAIAIWPRLRGPLPARPWRKHVAAMQMNLQVVLLAPIVMPPVSQAIGALILGLVALSFAADIRLLLARGTRRESAS